MKRMNHGGSLGSQHQLQAGLGSNQVMIIYNNINNKTICCVPRTKSKKAQQHSYIFIFHSFSKSSVLAKTWWANMAVRRRGSSKSLDLRATVLPWTKTGETIANPSPLCPHSYFSIILDYIEKCIALLFGFTLLQNHVLRRDDWLPDYWTIITTITIIIILIFIITSSSSSSSHHPPAVPRWEDRLSSSSQNNLVNLSSGQQLPGRPDSRWALIDQSNSWRRSRNRAVKNTNM